MDFKDTPGSYDFMLPLEIIEVESTQTKLTTIPQDDRWDLAMQNEHLIEKCLESKRTDILNEAELKKYGRLALYSAANDFIHGLDFEEFALKRIERQMNMAIAEELYFAQVDVNDITKLELNQEFQAIYKRFP